MNINIFLNQTLQELRDDLFNRLFILIYPNQMIVLKYLMAKSIIFLKV